MGVRGPAPMDNAELARRGSRRARGRGESLRLEAKAPDPPASLSAAARAEWRRVCRVLRPADVLTEADRIGLTLLCQLCVEDQELGALLQRLLPGSADWRSLARVRKDVRGQLMVMLARFGLTPADRPRVRRPAALRAAKVDPIKARLLRFRAGGKPPA